jgi:hypothetical protein
MSRANLFHYHIMCSDGSKENIPRLRTGTWPGDRPFSRSLATQNSRWKKKVHAPSGIRPTIPVCFSGG